MSHHNCYQRPPDGHDEKKVNYREKPIEESPFSIFSGPQPRPPPVDQFPRYGFPPNREPPNRDTIHYDHPHCAKK